MPHPKWVFGSDHGLSADATGAPAILLEDSRPQAILKLRPPIRLDYSTRNGCQPILVILVILVETKSLQPKVCN